MARRLLILDAFHACGGGGSKHALYGALARDWELEVVGCPWPQSKHLLMKLRAVRWPLQRWRLKYYDLLERYSLSQSAFRWRTERYQQLVTEKAADIDAIFQVGLVFGLPDPPAGKPYFTYHDSNMSTAWQLWRSWAPFSSQSEFEDFRRLEQQVLDSTTLVMTYSEFARQSFLRDYDLRPERVACVGSAVKFAEFPARRHMDVDGHNILFVATDFERKGGPELLRAFQQLRSRKPQVQLTLAGILPPMDWRKYPGVEAVGPVKSRAAMQKLYQQASLLVHPARYDPFPSVVLEAMTCGTPVVTTQVCGIPEQVDDGETGWIVPPGDVEALTEAMSTALDNTDRLRQMGQLASRRTWERYSPERVADNIGERMRAFCN